MWIQVNQEQLQNYLIGFCKERKETEWLEFKTNPDLVTVGEYISSLSNSAACLGRDSAYLVYGVDNDTHQIVGTKTSLTHAKIKNQEFESWLLQKLSPPINFKFHEFKFEDAIPVIIVEIQAAQNVPVKFDGEEYIRIGSYQKKLRSYPEKERELWRAFDKVKFEQQVATDALSSQGVFDLLNVDDYFKMLKIPLPETKEAALTVLQADQLIKQGTAGVWQITHLGALVLAKNLSQFPSLVRKTVRVIKYGSRGRLDTEREVDFNKGYASCFAELLRTVMLMLPAKEMIGKGLRQVDAPFSELAVRELLANALIHQDFQIAGTGPMIEIFPDRLEITNPGIPLVPPDRFLDLPPISRNEWLASLLRRMDICEERGSGFDKVATVIEASLTPAPRIEISNNHTRVTLFAPKSFSNLSKEERMQMCYLHCCLRYVNKQVMTNTSLRTRFGIGEKNRSMISRVIRDSVEASLVKAIDSSAGPRNLGYIPIWA